MPDDFAGQQPGLDSPAASAEAVVPSDAAPLAAPARALYVGSAGSLRVVMLAGQTVSFAGVQAGMVYPLRVTQVLATGTTAGGIVALR
jgi:hypothetical protein